MHTYVHSRRLKAQIIIKDKDSVRGFVSREKSCSSNIAPRCEMTLSSRPYLISTRLYQFHVQIQRTFNSLAIIIYANDTSRTSILNYPTRGILKRQRILFFTSFGTLIRVECFYVGSIKFCTEFCCGYLSERAIIVLIN